MENPLATIKTPEEADAFIAEHGACRVYFFKDQRIMGAQHAHIIRFRGKEHYPNPWLVKTELEGNQNAQATTPRSRWYIIPTYIFRNGLREVAEKDSHDWIGLKVNLWDTSYFPRRSPQKCKLVETISPGHWLVEVMDANSSTSHVNMREAQALDPLRGWYIYPIEFPPKTPSEISARRLERIFLEGSK